MEELAEADNGHGRLGEAAVPLLLKVHVAVVLVGVEHDAADAVDDADRGSNRIHNPSSCLVSGRVAGRQHCNEYCQFLRYRLNLGACLPWLLKIS